MKLNLFCHKTGRKKHPRTATERLILRSRHQSAHLWPKRQRQSRGPTAPPVTAAPKRGRDPQNSATLSPDPVRAHRVRPGRPRTAAAPGPRPHRSWSSIAAAGPRARAPPCWRPERRGPRHPQHGPSSQAHLVAEQLPHVHRTQRAPPPGTCRKPPGPRDTCRKAGGAGRVAGRHTAGKRSEGGRAGKGEAGCATLP